MELSVDVVKGLKLLGNSSSINEKCFSNLLEDAISIMTENYKTSSISQMQSDGAKESYAALLSVLVESARCDLDSDALSVLLLTKYHFPSHRIDKLVTTYKKNKLSIQAALANVGTQLPHIVDTNWKIDYCIQASNLGKSSELQYLIQLHTQSSTEYLHEPDFHTVRFICNFKELQDLIFKLKEAVKQVERVANAN